VSAQKAEFERIVKIRYLPHSSSIYSFSQDGAGADIISKHEQLAFYIL
jgi:hypothetical protein